MPIPKNSLSREKGGVNQGQAQNLQPRCNQLFLTTYTSPTLHPSHFMGKGILTFAPLGPRVILRPVVFLGIEVSFKVFSTSMVLVNYPKCVEVSKQFFGKVQTTSYGDPKKCEVGHSYFQKLSPRNQGWPFLLQKKSQYILNSIWAPLGSHLGSVRRYIFLTPIFL